MIDQLPDYKQAVELSDLRSGDFVYELSEYRYSGPRGGKHRVHGGRVMSEIVEIDHRTGEALFVNGLHVRFVYRTQTAVIKRRQEV